MEESPVRLPTPLTETTPLTVTWDPAHFYCKTREEDAFIFVLLKLVFLLRVLIYYYNILLLLFYLIYRIIFTIYSFISNMQMINLKNKAK